MTVPAGARLRAAVAAERPLQVVGVINAYAALLAERAGFRALYLSGAGVANAATGQAGEEDAERTAAHAAARLGLAPEQVLVLSTGVIGPRLPMAKLLAGVDEAAVALGVPLSSFYQRLKRLGIPLGRG